MNDLIRRENAIDAIERIYDQCEEIEAHFAEDDPEPRTGYKMFPDYLTVIGYLKQPAADNWIPVTERLPEEAREVLVTVRDAAESTTFVELAYLCHLGIFITTNDMTYLWSEDGYEVIAWQPLPDPYKEDNK